MANTSPQQDQETTLDIFAYKNSENMRRFISRSENIATLIRKEAQTAGEILRPYDGETKIKRR